MRGHEIGHNVLILGAAVVHAGVLVHEFFVHADVRLAHVVQNGIYAVLRRHLKLAGDMVFHQLPEKVVVFVLQHIVVADAGADEYLFYTGYLSQPLQKRQIFRVVGVQIWAGLGSETAPVGAHTAF